MWRTRQSARSYQSAAGRHSGQSASSSIQIETAHAHVLLTDPATRSAGYAVLDQASDIATRYGLKHQLRSIKTVRNSEEYT